MRWGAVLAVLALLASLLSPAARADESDKRDNRDNADEARQQVLVLLHLPPPHYRPDGAYSGSYADGVGRQARRAVAGRLAEAHGLKVVSDWALPSLGVDCYVLAVPPARAPAQVAEALAHDARVVWAQPMNVYRAQGTSHDDPLYAAQPAATAWRLAELHELASGRGVSVALVDSGVDSRHPDLLGQVALSRNFVDERTEVAELHGTALAGIIAARADNRIGIAGVAPQARLLALRGCWQARGDTTLCTSLTLAKALQFAIGSDAAVINLSLSGPPDRLLGQLLDAAIGRGATVVAAYDPTLPGGGFPASHAGVVAVADRPSASALMAPGHDVPAPAPGERWAVVSGASYASAHVAGLFALLRELGGPAPATLVRSAGGSIDTCATLMRATGPRACACAMALVAARP